MADDPCATAAVPACHYCGTTEDELRPYGPGGSWLCYRCMKASPEREAAAKAAFGALLDGAESISTTGVVAIGQESGPRPFDPEEARRRGNA